MRLGVKDSPVFVRKRTPSSGSTTRPGRTSVTYFSIHKTACSPIGIMRSFLPSPWRTIKVPRSTSRSKSPSPITSMRRMPVE